MIGLLRIDRYLALELARGYAIVALLLLALFSLLAFIDELQDVGDGSYGALEALRFVVMTTPSRILRLLPFMTLFGGALAIWQLARRSELVVLRAAGMSLSRVAAATMLPSLLLLVAVPVLHEFVAPTLYANAIVSRDMAIGREDQLAADGFWSRRGATLIEVERLEYGRVPSGVRIYELGPEAGLERVLVAASADPDEAGNWRLADAQQRSYTEDGRVERSDVSGELWRPWWADTRQLRVPPVDSLSFTDLRGYIAYLARTGQPTERWELAYWRMWLAPLTALLTGLLAIPIALTSTRDSGARHISLALAGGLGYYIFDQVLSNAGIVAGYPAPLVAAAAPVFLALVVGVMLRRLD